ncbi:hypothetical protein ACTFIT_011961 [Dictyostelium discoideum]
MEIDLSYFSNLKESKKNLNNYNNNNNNNNKEEKVEKEEKKEEEQVCGKEKESIEEILFWKVYRNKYLNRKIYGIIKTESYCLSKNIYDIRTSNSVDIDLIESVEWMVQNKHFGLLKYKLENKKGETKHIKIIKKTPQVFFQSFNNATPIEIETLKECLEILMTKYTIEFQTCDLIDATSKANSVIPFKILTSSPYNLPMYNYTVENALTNCDLKYYKELIQVIGDVSACINVSGGEEEVDFKNIKLPENIRVITLELILKNISYQNELLKFILQFANLFSIELISTLELPEMLVGNIEFETKVKMLDYGLFEKKSVKKIQPEFKQSFYQLLFCFKTQYRGKGPFDCGKVFIPDEINEKINEIIKDNKNLKELQKLVIIETKSIHYFYSNYMIEYGETIEEYHIKHDGCSWTNNLKSKINDDKILFFINYLSLFNWCCEEEFETIDFNQVSYNSLLSSIMTLQYNENYILIDSFETIDWISNGAIGPFSLRFISKFQDRFVFSSAEIAKSVIEKCCNEKSILSILSIKNRIFYSAILICNDDLFELANSLELGITKLGNDFKLPENYCFTIDQLGSLSRFIKEGKYVCHFNFLLSFIESIWRSNATSIQEVIDKVDFKFLPITFITNSFFNYKNEHRKATLFLRLIQIIDFETPFTDGNLRSDRIIYQNNIPYLFNVHSQLIENYISIITEIVDIVSGLKQLRSKQGVTEYKLANMTTIFKSILEYMYDLFLSISNIEIKQLNFVHNYIVSNGIHIENTLYRCYFYLYHRSTKLTKYVMSRPGILEVIKLVNNRNRVYDCNINYGPNGVYDIKNWLNTKVFTFKYLFKQDNSLEKIYFDLIEHLSLKQHQSEPLKLSENIFNDLNFFLEINRVDLFYQFYNKLSNDSKYDKIWFNIEPTLLNSICLKLNLQEFIQIVEFICSPLEKNKRMILLQRLLNCCLLSHRFDFIDYLVEQFSIQITGINFFFIKKRTKQQKENYDFYREAKYMLENHFDKITHPEIHKIQEQNLKIKIIKETFLIQFYCYLRKVRDIHSFLEAPTENKIQIIGCYLKKDYRIMFQEIPISTYNYQYEALFVDFKNSFNGQDIIEDYINSIFNEYQKIGIKSSETYYFRVDNIFNEAFKRGDIKLCNLIAKSYPKKFKILKKACSVAIQKNRLHVINYFLDPDNCKDLIASFENDNYLTNHLNLELKNYKIINLNNKIKSNN